MGEPIPDALLAEREKFACGFGHGCKGRGGACDLEYNLRSAIPTRTRRNTSFDRMTRDIGRFAIMTA